MSFPRAHFVLLLAVLCAAVLVAVGLMSPSPSQGSNMPFGASHSTRAATPLRVVGLGDSVPAAYHCGCAGFVSVAARTLARERGRTAVTGNHAVSGATSADLLSQLGDQAVRSDLVAADVVVVEIGANDFDENSAYERSCRDATTSGCYDHAVATLRGNLQQIVSGIKGLNQHATVVLLGYWNVFRDGSVGAAQGATYVAASDSLTRWVNDLVRQVAQSSGASYADAFTPFKGADGDSDDTSYLSDDGDHPNANGHDVLANAVVAAVDG